MVIHCTAGKDRTGVIVMMLLMLAGCSNTEIAKEYHMSEAGLGPDWRLDAIRRLSENPVFDGKPVEVIERMIGARKDVMKAVVDMVVKDFGSIERLLIEEMKIEAMTLNACKKVLRRGKSASLDGKIIVDANLVRAAGLGGL